MRSIKRINWFLVVGILLGVSLLVAAVSLYLVQQQRIDAQHARIVADAKANAKLQDQYQGVVGQYAKAYGQLEQSGVEPTTVPPSALPSAPGSSGSNGADGRDGRGVAFTLCTATGWAVTYTDGTTENSGNCVGATGKPGAAGADGSAGAAGQDGSDGVSVVGPVGPVGPAGVAGADGAPGAPGVDGKDGTGVASVTCVATDAGTAFRFTLTDGSTRDVDGACTPPPTPTETPAP